MDDLISRQAAIDALEKVADKFLYRIPGNAETYRTYNEAWNDAIDDAETAIEDLPSAQPEIIHCKDCEYSQRETVNGHEYLSCDVTYDESGFWAEVKDDHFCSYAERREE